MTKSQLDLGEKEYEIINCCKFAYNLKNKSDAINKLIQIAGESEPIKNLLNEKKKDKIIK